jgi:HPt (histidine-containing phosphotransfer) domain-containing protein
MSKIDLNTFNTLKETTGEDFIVELIDTFLGEAPGLITQMQSALASQDADTFRRAAHSMKSNAATFGALELSALSKELEGFGREKNLEIGYRLEVLEAVFQQVAEELEALKA